MKLFRKKKKKKKKRVKLRRGNKREGCSENLQILEKCSGVREAPIM